MADLCGTISKNIASSNCASKGGTALRSWVFLAAMFTGAYSLAADKSISGFSLKAGAKGIKALGQPKKGSGAHNYTQNENLSSEVEQTLVQLFKYRDQPQLDALTEYLEAGGKVVFQEMADESIRIYFKEYGHETATAEDGTGTLLTDDSNVMKVTLKGKEPRFPLFFKAPVTGDVTQLAASRAYLDELCVADV